MKVMANHLLVNRAPYCMLQAPPDSDELCWTWRAQDCSEEPAFDGVFALKFDTAEFARSFLEAFNLARTKNATIMYQIGKKLGDDQVSQAEVPVHRPGSANEHEQKISAGVQMRDDATE